ncbi:MAG: S8 family peptidase [Elusimicrobiota bacterium]|nr:S8 family peptidase [Elusimicrobiota bacterium]
MLKRAGAALVLALISVPARALETETLMRPSAVGVARPVTVVKGQLIVKFSTGTGSVQRDNALAVLGATGSSPVGSQGWQLIQLAPGLTTAEGLQRVAGLTPIVDVQPNAVYSFNRVPNDTLFASQYGLDQINAKGAWDYDIGQTNTTTIAIVDSGISGTHPELSGKMAGLSHRFCNAASCATVDAPTVACNHATRVAGIAAASSDNSSQIAGVSWGAKLLSLRVFAAGTCTADCGNVTPNSCTTTDAAIVNAIAHVRTLVGNPLYGRLVINMSLGGAGACAAGTAAEIAGAVSDGIPVIVSAGNDGGAVNSPGNCPAATPVAATDSSGGIASFSSRGPELAANGLAAPGSFVLSTDVGDGTVNGISGTSFAAPHVAGAAALILSGKPAFTESQVISTLRQSADPVGLGASSVFKTAGGNSFGAGRLNAFLAMQLAIKGQLADFQGEEKVVAFPNPYRGGTHQNITFAFPPSLQGSTNVSIKIYTLDGAFVRELNSLTWNVKNSEGQPVASGTYVYVVSASQGTKSGRFSVLR